MEEDEITIQGTTFKVPMRYKEGDELTEDEAAALNQTYHENVRNNVAAKMKKGDAVDQAFVTQYATEYQFGSRAGGGPQNPVHTQAMNIAKARVKAKLKEMIAQPGSKYFGRKMGDFTNDAINDAAKRAIDGDPGITELAKRRVAEEREAAASALSDLGDLALRADTSEAAAQAAQ